MALFTLWFSNETGTTCLDKTTFQSPLSGELKTIRGKTPGAFRGQGSFQWTSAVKALSILSVEWAGADNGEHFVLSGGNSSPASSLAYAIAKKTSWLMDMFGVDSKGVLFAGRIISMSNSHRKHGEIVSLSMNAALLKPSDIRVHLNGKLLEEQALRQLAEQLRGSWDKARMRQPARGDESASDEAAGMPLAPGIPTQRIEPGVLENFRSIIREELTNLLSQLIGGRGNGGSHPGVSSEVLSD